VLGKARELWVRTGADKDAGIAFGEGAPPLTLERPGDNHRSAAHGAGVDDLVDEVNQLVWKANGNLLAHPKTVPNR